MFNNNYVPQVKAKTSFWGNTEEYLQSYVFIEINYVN